MVGLIFPQHVINEIRRKSDLPPRLALARVLPLDKAADDSNIAEGAFQQGTTLHPVDKLMLQYVGGKQARRIGDGFQAIDSQRVIIGDKSDGEQPLAFHPPRQQHAQRLVRVPSLERSEEHTSELQSLMRSSYAVFCLKKKKTNYLETQTTTLN